ncbi:hypothetical protein FisN_5Hh201 [Fistulifera solaris]|uniref:WW domain-containing protein n=1 Tax=Fistulifera solaris TaxID=1519565 RepID=A0A1Z5JS99_FISSO|nr:hypothetical protein FisN_5Hh201 [Fistulifera solaris]|eukprot:GAX16829.1 hypothetical protein FisN_5Hh201 [Fistulifera solaris]
MRHSRILRFIFVVISFLCHWVDSAAWVAAFHSRTTTSKAASSWASSRSPDEDVAFSLNTNPNANSTMLDNDNKKSDSSQASPMQSGFNSQLSTLQYNPRQPEYFYGDRSGREYKSRRRKKSDSWDDDQQQQVFAALSEIIQQDAPDSPSEVISPTDMAQGKELIEAWSKSTLEPDPTGLYDDELYRAVFSQEPDFFKTKEKEKEDLDQKEREFGELSPARLRQKELQDQRREANRLKLVQGLEDYIKELEAAEEKQPTQLKCRRCKCIMTSEAAASQGQLCQVCQAELLIASTKNEPVRPQRRQYWTNPNLRSYNPPVQPRPRPRPRGDGKAMAFGDLMNGMLENVNKRENNSTAVSESNQDESSGPWCETIDPDTGKVFYWNEETGEMRWEL